MEISFIKNVLTTQGISSSIGAHLILNLKDLRSFYLLINDSRYREEIEPIIRTHYRNRILEDLETDLQRIDKGRALRSLSQETLKNWLLALLYNKIYKNRRFLEYDDVILRMHSMFPQEFRYAMDTYLCCYALACETRKRSHYNKYRSFTHVFTKEDLISYPIHTSSFVMKGLRICNFVDQSCSCYYPQKKLIQPSPYLLNN